MTLEEIQIGTQDKIFENTEKIDSLVAQLKDNEKKLIKVNQELSFIKKTMGKDKIKITKNKCYRYKFDHVEKSDKWEIELISFYCALDIDAYALPPGKENVKHYSLGGIYRKVEGHYILTVGYGLTEPFYEYKKRMWYPPSADFYDEKGELLDQLDIVIKICPADTKECDGYIIIRNVE